MDEVKAEINAKLKKKRARNLADTKMTVIIDKVDAERLIQVWEASGVKDGGYPGMMKKGDSIMLAHPDLLNVYGCVTDSKSIERTRDSDRLTVVDMKSLKEDVNQLGPKWDKVDIRMEGYRIKT